MNDGPLIVQSDKTLLLEVDHEQAAECRKAIAPFAELERSPEESTPEFDNVVPNFDMYVALTAAPTLCELLVATLRHLGARPEDLTLQTSQ